MVFPINQRIFILPTGNINELEIELIGADISKVLDTEIEFLDYTFLPKEAFNKMRNQYDAEMFLQKILKHSKPRNVVLGITDVDLFVSSLNFIFGLAQVNYGAIISLCRLRPEFYNFPRDLNRLVRRGTKEAIHELGHVFGISHCDNSKCVMSFSNSIGKVDRKYGKFCKKHDLNFE